MRLYLIIAAIYIFTAIGFYTYFQYSQNKIAVLTQNNAKLELSVGQQNEAINSLDSFMRKQSNDLLQLQESNKSLQQEKLELSNKLIKHDWEELSRRKPILMQNRINNGTKELFDSLESITAN